MKRSFVVALLLVTTGVAFQTSSYAQQQAAAPQKPQQLTEGQFATQLSQLLKVRRYLPMTYTVYDTMNLMEAIGIEPLDGWHPNRPLTPENYVILLSLTLGKGDAIKEKAQEICDQTADYINARWALQFQKDGNWAPLDQLLKDKTYFPQGIPPCPYRAPYRAKKGDHTVLHHKHAGYALLQAKLKKAAKTGQAPVIAPELQTAPTEEQVKEKAEREKKPATPAPIQEYHEKYKDITPTESR